MSDNEIIFINRLIKHIRLVQDNMIWLEVSRKDLPFEINKWELLKRGMQHDLSKFDKDLVEGYVLTNEYFRNKRLKKSVEHINLKSLKEYWNIHERLERHHPEYKTEMSNLDLCEMCCDLYAMSQELKEEDHLAYFKNKLCKDVPLVKKYSKECIDILELLHGLNNLNS